jgi:hypothetical protein
MYSNRKIISYFKNILFIGSICFLFGFNTIKVHSVVRQKVSLNGTWEFKWDNEKRLSYPPNDKGWTKIKVAIISQYATGFGTEGSNHWAWYRRKVRVPDSMKGQRIKLRFSSVKYKAGVYWNGEKVGEHSDGYIPFEIDITDKIDFSKENELLVGVIDHIALQRPDVLPYSRYEYGYTGKHPLSPPYETVIGPVYRTERPIGGICDNVDIVSYPKVYIEDFHITTSVRRSHIMVQVSVLNQSIDNGSYEAAVFIEDKGKIINDFPKQSVLVASGKSVGLLFEESWKNPHLWSHEDPYLYTMIFRIYQNDKIIDEKKFRFGFREYWIEGTQFYLNGRVFKVRRNHFNYGATYEDAKRYMKTLKSINVNQIRLHHKGAPEWILSMADEIGMTLCPESAFYTRWRWYDIENPKMWENARIHWAGIVKSAKNHPSVVMYSLENEMISTARGPEYLDKRRRYRDNWIKIGQYVRSLDPTKPLQYSSGTDIDGWCETVNIHYPRDIKYFFQYPNDLYWNEHEQLTEKKGFGIYGRGSKKYYWKKDKPLIMGEYGFWYHCNPPHGLTAFIGDDAYVENNWYKTYYWCLKKKYYKYSGIAANPWVYTKDREDIFPLQEVFLKDWQSNYYSKELLRKEIIVLNEDYHSKSLQLKVKLTSKNKILDKKNISIKLKEGEKWINEISFKLPDVKKRLNANLDMILINKGKEVNLNSHPIHIFPVIRPVKYDINKTGLYDPDGKSFRELISSGFIFTKVDNLINQEISKLNILIIGKDAVDIQFRSYAILLNEFVNKGGRIIFLEQTKVETMDWLPFKIDIDKHHSSTIAFQAIPDHPILNKIEKDDLKFWRGTHQVSKYNFIRPCFWNFNTISYVGGEKGIDHTPLVTLPYGKGLFVFSQFIISEEMSKEPAAFILFNNMLKYVSDYTSSYNKTGVFADSKSFLSRALTMFGADVEYIDNFPPPNLNSYDVLFIDCKVNLENYKYYLKEYLTGGGKIVLREITPDTYYNIKSILPEDISIAPMPEVKYYLPNKSTQDLKISFSPHKKNMNSYPLGWENELELSELRCPIRAYKVDYNSIFAGITNTDLYWRTPTKYSKMFDKEIAPIASHVITGNNMIPFTQPAIIAIIPHGDGEIIIDQIDWETGLKKVTDSTCRIISNFLNNLKIKMKPNISYNEE